MNKRKIKFIALAVAIVIFVASVCAGAASVIVQDSLFKNNTPTYMALNSQATGIIKSADDYDAYIFEVPANGALVVRLDHEGYDDNAKTGWQITLYKIIDGEERLYKELTYFESFWSDITSTWGETGVTPGTYCVVVKAGTYFIETNYTLVTMFTETETYEKEPNDTIEEATPIAVKYGKYGSSSRRENGTDTDWYVLELLEDSIINITFTHNDKTLPVVGWSVTLYDSSDKLITQFTSRLNETIVKTGIMGLQTGTYYIVVEAQSEVPDTYTILVGSDKATNNEFELNDTPETATNLPESVVIGGSLADRILGLDKDYYKFTVPAEGYIDFEFEHEILEGDKRGWNIRLLKPLEDGSYHEIVRKISMWNEERLVIEDMGLYPGDYYICIDGDSVSYNSSYYTCKWSFTEAENFEHEPNGTIETCDSAEFGKYYHGAIISTDSLYDEDYYKFELEKDTRICLEFYHEAGSVNEHCWTASVVDESGKEYCSTNSYLNEHLVTTGVVLVPAGTYYVKIETGIYGSEIPYYFRLVR